jgi:hypothetical protein
LKSTRYLPVALFAACLTTPAAPSFDEAAITTACTDQANAVCALRSSCSPLYDFLNTQTFGGDDACREREALVCLRNLHVADTGQTPAHVETCAQSYANFSCSAFETGALPDRCITTGPGSTGDACASNAQCMSDFCALPNHQICGTCQPQPAIGSVCETRTQCGHDLVCAVPVNETTGVCVLPAAEGMPCLTGKVPCFATESCVGSDVATSTMGVCHPGGKTVGEPCDSSTVTMANCDGSLGLSCTGTAGTCQPTVLVDAGALCGAMGANNARTVYTCSLSGQCVKVMGINTCIAAAGDGEPCSTDTTVGPPCVTPAICVTAGDATTTGVCTLSDPAACF